MKQIQSLQHPLVKALTQLRKDTKSRKEHQRAVVEGKKLVAECVSLATKILAVDELLFPKDSMDAEHYLVTSEILKKISGVKNPEGILAEIRISKQQLPDTLTHLLVLDGINDPGNLGTLIRTALALGWQGVYLLGSCCDPFNDKAIRSAKGASFRLPIVNGTCADLQAVIKAHGLRAWVADLEGETICKLPGQKKAALIMGSESHGPSDEVKKIAERVTIEISSSMESLNVASAGAILMYQLIDFQ